MAIDQQFLDNQKRKTFWLAPFYAQSKTDDIFFSVISATEFSESFVQYIQQLPEQKPISVTLPKETSKATYFQEIENFLSAIQSGQLNKAVLSRVIYQNKPEDFNAVDFFLKLATDYPDTFAHLSLHPQSGIWIGATPELLIKKNNQTMNVMALAGTQARKNVGERYEWRQKEMDEHIMVNQHIEQVFENNHAVLSDQNGPRTVEAAKVAHLRTDFIFNEQQKIHLPTLLKELHPTPSVGGLPVKKGIECILKYENYNRSYYCGFLGETDFDSTANIYINLRCLQVGQQQLAIYVGGGITAASVPEEEWEETILKSKTMIDKIQSKTLKFQNGTIG